MKLNDRELRELNGLYARDREIARLYIMPLRQDYAAFLRDIEARLELAPDAIGKTHRLNLETLEIELVEAAAEID